MGEKMRRRSGNSPGAVRRSLQAGATRQVRRSNTPRLTPGRPHRLSAESGAQKDGLREGGGEGRRVARRQARGSKGRVSSSKAGSTPSNTHTPDQPALWRLLPEAGPLPTFSHPPAAGRAGGGAVRRAALGFGRPPPPPLSQVRAATKPPTLSPQPVHLPAGGDAGEAVEEQQSTKQGDTLTSSAQTTKQGDTIQSGQTTKQGDTIPQSRDLPTPVPDAPLSSRPLGATPVSEQPTDHTIERQKDDAMRMCDLLLPTPEDTLDRQSGTPGEPRGAARGAAGPPALKLQLATPQADKPLGPEPSSEIMLNGVLFGLRTDSYRSVGGAKSPILFAPHMSLDLGPSPMNSPSSARPRRSRHSLDSQPSPMNSPSARPRSASPTTRISVRRSLTAASFASAKSPHMMDESFLHRSWLHRVGSAELRKGMAISDLGSEDDISDCSSMRQGTWAAPVGGPPRTFSDFPEGTNVVHLFRGLGVVTEVGNYLSVNFGTGANCRYTAEALQDGRLQPADGCGVSCVVDSRTLAHLGTMPVGGLQPTGTMPVRQGTMPTQSGLTPEFGYSVTLRSTSSRGSALKPSGTMPANTNLQAYADGESSPILERVGTMPADGGLEPCGESGSGQPPARAGTMPSTGTLQPALEEGAMGQQTPVPVWYLPLSPRTGQPSVVSTTGTTTDPSSPYFGSPIGRPHRTPSEPKPDPEAIDSGVGSPGRMRFRQNTGDLKVESSLRFASPQRRGRQNTSGTDLESTNRTVQFASTVVTDDADILPLQGSKAPLVCLIGVDTRTDTEDTQPSGHST
eukprot:Hpha_TRINITY_DN12590_c0_g1::TRINITY_DN12590_c0_g1_i1::g.50920::m.50920